VAVVDMVEGAAAGDGIDPIERSQKAKDTSAV
jgi:hypothetical protein